MVFQKNRKYVLIVLIIIVWVYPIVLTCSVSQRLPLKGVLKNVTLLRSAKSENKKRPIEMSMLRSILLSPREINYRLPGDVAPKQYNLTLYPDVFASNFSGLVSIDLHILRETNKFVLHSHGLNIEDVRITKIDNMNIGVSRYNIDTTRDFLIIEVGTDVHQGEVVTLSIRFRGRMDNKIVGLYSSTYKKPGGELKRIATSKFEPTYARQAFPCFDEPAMKATFKVQIVHPTDEDYIALSNMDAMNTVSNGSTSTTFFRESVPMSTYLACFIVSDFQFKSKSVNTNGIGKNFDIRAFATPHQLNKVEFALNTSVSAIEYYIQYFQIEYPLPKLDMAAIPDFSSGAMEHWGLVTYRETALLYDPDTNSASNLQRVATVVAHELAHMWFGNLVTMKWWNDLWLNEGFATFMEYKCVNNIFPSWEMLDQFIVEKMNDVMRFDSTTASHPILQKVSSPDQITSIFDMITYNKGASVIRMLEDFVGVDKFQIAVKNYLTKFKYSNAVTDDFLTEVAALDLDIDIKKVIRTWTEQKGLPVVEIYKVSPTEYKLHQKRFLSNPSDYKFRTMGSQFNYTWTIPITYSTSASSEVQRLWFEHDAAEASIVLPEPVEWIKLNIKQIGFYRVNYAEDIWKILSAELLERPESFSSADRANLLSDAFALADSNQLAYKIALDMINYLNQEYDYLPWTIAASKIVTLHTILRYTDIHQEYQHYMKELVMKIYNHVSWTVGNDHLMNRLRGGILYTACFLGVEDCLTQASARFQVWLTEPSERPSPDLRHIVYYFGMHTTGTKKVWDRMWKIFLSELDPSEKVKLMNGLAGVQDSVILFRFVEMAWNETYVRRQDYFTCLQYIAANPIGENIVWDYVREHWPQLVNRFGLNDRYLGQLIPTITSRFTTQTKLNDMINFFERYPDAGAGATSRNQALETVKNNIRWLEENKSDVEEWLQGRRHVL